MASNDEGPVAVSTPTQTAPATPPGGDEKTLVPGPEEAPAANPRPEREAGLGDFIRVFKYATKWDLVAYAVGGLASIGAGTTLPLMNVVFGSFVNNFVDVEHVSMDQFSSDLDRLSLYVFLLFLGRFALNTINKFAFRMIGIRLSSAVRLHYLQSLFGQSIHVLDSMPPGAAASTITSTANVLQLGISEKLGMLAEWTSTIVTAIIIAFVWSWELALVTFSVVIFLLLVIGIIMPLILKGYNSSEKANTKASAIESEALASIRMVMASGAENRILERVRPHVLDVRKHGRSIAPVLGLQLGAIFFGIYAAFGLAFWYGVKAYLAGRVSSIGQITICLMSVMMMVISLERISSPMVAIGKAMVAAAQFFVVIDAPRPEFGNLKDPDVTAAQDIVFKDVTFAYPSRSHVKILDRLNLTIEAGKVTAIVGPSGSGKSTIVALVERWYNLRQQHVIAAAIGKKKNPKQPGQEDEDEPIEQPEEIEAPIELKGAVETCGHSLDEIDIKWWRSQIGLVQQEPVLFNTTILQNVANGLIGSPWEHEPVDTKLELVKEACKQAFADEFIDRLPEGYNTNVGDGGAKLSGGQRQRIAIARSIVRKPKILILDEATSAIDVRGERIVQAALDRASEGRTTITIAHRLSTIKKADRIIVLKGGRVVEEGNHESLLKIEGGVYHGLVYAQQLSLGDGPQESDDDEVRDEELGGVISHQKSTAASESAPVTAPKNKDEKQKSFLAGFGFILVEQKSQWPWYGLIILFAAAAGSNVAILAYLFANVINIFELQGGELRSQANFWSLMFVVFAIGLCFSYFFLISISSLVAASVRAAYRIDYFTNILFQKPSYFDDEANPHGTLTSRVVGDPKQLEEFLGVPMAFVILALFSLIGALSIAFAFNWKLALLGFFVTMPINILATYWRFRSELEFEELNNAVFKESSQFASESIGAARTVAALTLEGPITSRYNELLNGHVKAALRMAQWRSPLFAISDSISIACQALVLWYGGRMLLRNEIGILNFFVCFMAVIQGAEAAGQGLSFGPNAAQVTAASNRILDARATRNDDTVSQNEKVPDADGGMKIELQDVHFKYQHSERSAPVFKGLSLTIEKGRFAALVGASGSGKTSIISLLERFYEPSRGRILCNDTDIANMNVYAWRKYLSLVAQEASLLQGTIRENILLGVDASTVTEERIHKVCRDASIHDFIVSLPEGYNTNIGSRGVSLSGGQKQRLSIARALIRDPKVLLLDEATSSLDSESEKLVQEAFERASNGRTMVVVAHRLATIQRADVIFVLGEGKLLEQGNHRELLQKRGVYWGMCQSQALDR